MGSVDESVLEVVQNKPKSVLVRKEGKTERLVVDNDCDFDLSKIVQVHSECRVYRTSDSVNSMNRPACTINEEALHRAEQLRCPYVFVDHLGNVATGHNFNIYQYLFIFYMLREDVI